MGVCLGVRAAYTTKKLNFRGTVQTDSICCCDCDLASMFKRILVAALLASAALGAEEEESTWPPKLPEFPDVMALCECLPRRPR